MRIIGAETTGAADLYWYVPADSPIKSLKDTEGKTIAYSTNGSSTHGIVTAFMKQYDLKAKPTATGGPAPTLTQVMSGQIDVGWSAPPFGMQQLDEGKIRIIASGNDAAAFKGQTVRLLHHQRADAADSARPCIERFMKAYRETIDWMYSNDPAALKTYADFVGIPGDDGQAHARRLLPQGRRSIRTRSSASTRSSRTRSTLKYTAAPLTKEQLAELIQIPPR